MRSKLASFLIGLGFAASPALVGAETLLQNDNVGETFDGTSSAARLIDGEMYEAVFDIPEDWLPVTMLGVRVVMVKDPSFALGCGRFGIEVWEESAAPPMNANCIDATFNSITVGYKSPGAQIFTQDAVIDPQTSTTLGFEIRGDETRGTATFKDLRFSTINMTPGITLNPIVLNTTRVRVGLKALDLQCTAGGMIGSGDHYPVLISDLNGVSAPERNFVYGEPLLVAGVPLCSNVNGAQHYVWEDFGPAFQNSQPGDFVFRLILDRDSGNNMNPDMGGGTTDMGGGTTDMGGNNTTPDMNVGTDTGGNGNNTSNNNTGGGALMITSVTPGSGDNGSSTDIVIVGSGFEAGAEVLLDATNIGVTETQSGRIRATVPEGLTAGGYDLVVTNPDGETAILMDGFTVTEFVDDGDGKGGASSDGCCSSVDGQRRSSGVGLGLAGLLLGLVGLRRRRETC